MLVNVFPLVLSQLPIWFY